MRLLVRRYNGQQILVKGTVSVTIETLKQLMGREFGVEVADQHLFHGMQELHNGETIGHWVRRKKNNRKRAIEMQLLVATTVNVHTEDEASGSISLRVLDRSTVGQIKQSVCRQLGWDADGYALFVNGCRASDKRRIGDIVLGKKVGVASAHLEEQEPLTLCVKKHQQVGLHKRPLVWLKRRLASTAWYRSRQSKLEEV
ncbi:hypothetical protein GGI07_005417 [Coemansia sp. Benny D115]|nr:hypothetical protein GGI07_005417 [Coemansia sp. Benny D115]